MSKLVYYPLQYLPFSNITCFSLYCCCVDDFPQESYPVSLWEVANEQQLPDQQSWHLHALPGSQMEVGSEPAL